MENFVFVDKQVLKVEAKILEKWIVFYERRSVSDGTQASEKFLRKFYMYSKLVVQMSEKINLWESMLNVKMLHTWAIKKWRNHVGIRN